MILAVLLILLAQLMGLLILHEFIIEEHALVGCIEFLFNCEIKVLSIYFIFMLLTLFVGFIGFLAKFYDFFLNYFLIIAF